MIDTERHRVDVRTQTPRDEDPRNARRRVQVAAVDKLHLTVDGRTLCGLVTVDELDLYSDDVALRAWTSAQQTAEPGTASTPRRRSPTSRFRGNRHRTSCPETNAASMTRYSPHWAAPRLSGMPAVMNPKLISRHIGLITGTAGGPSPQAVSAALKRLAQAELVQRAGRSRTCWTVTHGA
jgi:hypothetical protein